MQLSIASSSKISIPIIEAIITSEHTLVSIITNPDKSSGRGQLLKPNDLATWAQERNLPLAKPADASELNRHLLDAQPQLIITIAYGRIIPVELLHGPRFGWINLHFSLLPKLRGAAPVQWAILNGDKTTGFTIFKLDKGMDTGPIYLSKEIDIDPQEKTGDLLNRISHAAVDDLLELLKVIGKTRATPQPISGATYAPKISKDMGRIEWNKPIEYILRQDRALSENPGIWTTYKSERISLFGLSETLIANQLTKPGEIALIDGKLIVRTEDSIVEISEVTPAGKKRMSGSDFANGARLGLGSKFE